MTKQCGCGANHQVRRSKYDAPRIPLKVDSGCLAATQCLCCHSIPYQKALCCEEEFRFFGQRAFTSTVCMYF